MPKILIVEDNESDRVLVRAHLLSNGYNDLTFTDNGEEGVELCQKEYFDIVILDTMLPGIDGFETCRVIKDNSDSKVGKIVICTGQIDAVDAVKAREYGADDYCVKTVDYEDLMEILKTFTSS